MFLFKPRWKNENREKAVKAVNQIHNDQQLFEISQQAPDRQARQAALDAIRDENLLYRVANDTFHYSEEQRANAVKGIRDPKLLLDLAQNAKTIQQYGGLSKNAEKYGAYGCVRTAAVAQIDSEELLETVADTEDSDLNDQSAGVHGYHNFQAKVIQAAIDKISDPERLKRLAVSGRSYTTRKHSVERLSRLKADRGILKDIARNAPHYDARKQAMTELLGKGYLSDKELAASLKDQGFLYDFAKNQPNMGSGFNDYDRAAAVRKLNDPSRVKEFLDFNNGEVRRAAAARLEELEKNSSQE